MKLITMLTLAVTAMAGCATSPQEVIERGSRHTGTIDKPPQEAARCIARNAEYTSSAFLTNVSQIDNDSAEVIVRSTIEITTTMSVWRFRRNGTASTFETWVSPSLLVSHETHIKRVRGSC